MVIISGKSYVGNHMLAMKIVPWSAALLCKGSVSSSNLADLRLIPRCQWMATRPLPAHGVI